MRTIPIRVIGRLGGRVIGHAIGFALLCAGAGGGCGWPGETIDRIGPVPARAGTVVVEGCALDATQTSALTAGGNARRVVQDVILLCLSADANGDLSPRDPAARADLAAWIDWLHGAGYRARLGLAMADASGARPDPRSATALLGDAGWRQRVAGAVTALGLDHDGLELALPTLTDAAALSLSSFVSQLSAAVRPRALGLFVPPSVSIPSDLPGGDAYSQLLPFVDRIRVMTLDYSCCGAGPGPTIDAGWAVDAARLAGERGARALDVAVPLYGWDFGFDGSETPIGFSDARDLAVSYRAEVTREAAGALHFAYDDRVKGRHEVWYDDAVSTVRTLEAWQPDVLPAPVGIVYYGLGAEDPALWPSLARAAAGTAPRP